MFDLMDFEFSNIEPPLAALGWILSGESGQQRTGIRALILEIKKLGRNPLTMQDVLAGIVLRNLTVKKSEEWTKLPVQGPLVQALEIYYLFPPCKLAFRRNSR